MFDTSSWPLWMAIAVFVVAAAIIAWTGVRLADYGNRLADRTGLGEAVTGTIFLGLTTALPGLAASVTAALNGYPALAISNAIGGIAVQTAFLAVADIVYRKANLEHAAASVTNMIMSAMLILLLALTLLGLTGPDIVIRHVHPVTPLLFLGAVLGFWLVYRSRVEPMWRPRRTAETVEDIPQESYRKESMSNLLAGFAFNALLVMAAGALTAAAVARIADLTGLSETVAGGFLSGIATSLPELVTTIAAVRIGALSLAVADIIGGNFFDVLFVFAADLVYVRGSLYHAPGVSMREPFLTGLAILLNITLLLGLLYRQRSGPVNIGFESVLMLLMYVAGFLVLGFLM
jgi:cation:H+ antiporter